MDKTVAMSPNLLVRYLRKPASEFTRADIVRFCVENEVECINFHYCGWDGRLKTLNFVIHSQEHLENILEAGERVDGSSLFPFIEAGKSDLYVLPKYRTAFVNPFSEALTVDLLCSYFNREGEPFESSPEFILQKAHKAFQEVTGMKMETMGELEYYVIADAEGLYQVADQKGYHESAPFNKFTDLRTEAMRLIAKAGGKIKYGHSEVGNFTQGGRIYEQNEIEFLPVDIEEAADQLVVAKWIMRQLAYKYKVVLTFAPKITAGKAGSGMHVHCRFTRDGRSMMTRALVRVPLGWLEPVDMAAKCNPLEEAMDKDFSDKQTFEWRASDGFADTYLLMAALCAAARHGFEMPDALQVAERTYVGLGVNIHDADNRALEESLEQLPSCCVDAAAELEKDREIYTSRGVFSDAIVDYTVRFLREFRDEKLREELKADPKRAMMMVNMSINNG